MIFIENKSYEEIGRIYKVSGSAIKKAALRLGLKLKPKRKINKSETFHKGEIFNEKGVCLNCGKEFIKYSNKKNIYCSNKCQQEYKHKVNYSKIIEGHPSIMRANYSPSIFRNDILKEQDNKCHQNGMVNH